MLVEGWWGKRLSGLLRESCGAHRLGCRCLSRHTVLTEHRWVSSWLLARFKIKFGILLHPQCDCAERIDLVGDGELVNDIRVGYVHITRNIGIQVEPRMAGFARGAPISRELYEWLWIRGIWCYFSDER